MQKQKKKTRRGKKDSSANAELSRGRGRQRERRSFREICRCAKGLKLAGAAACAAAALFSHCQEGDWGGSHALIHLRMDSALRVASRDRSPISGRKSNRTNKQSRKYAQAGRIQKKTSGLNHTR